MRPSPVMESSVPATVDASPEFARVLREAYPDLETMERVIQEVRARLPTPTTEDFSIRKLNIGESTLHKKIKQYGIVG